MKKTLLPILLATAWISISEFVRNTFLLHAHWVKHYQDLGLVFPEAGMNGAIWGIWSTLFAVYIFVLNQKFNNIQTTILAWISGFVSMWLVIGNLNVLPFSILPIAIPLSMLEVYVAVLLIEKFKA